MASLRNLTAPDVYSEVVIRDRRAEWRRRQKRVKITRFGIKVLFLAAIAALFIWAIGVGVDYQIGR